MKNLILVISMGLVMSCSIGRKSTSPDLGFELSKITVQQSIAGMERGNTKFDFRLYFSKINKNTLVDSIVYNGASSKLHMVKEDNRSPMYVATIYFSHEQMKEFSKSEFNKSKADIKMRVSGDVLIYPVDSLTILENVYMP